MSAPGLITLFTNFPSRVTRHPKLRLIYLVPLAIIIVTGIFFAVFPLDDDGAKAASASHLDVKIGTNYFVFVRSLEIAPKTPAGKSWDLVGGEAPDPYYEVHWRDNRIFASSTQRNQLIAHWSPLGVDTIKSIREGRLAIDSVIKAALIRATGEESFELRIYDDDPIAEDEIATLTFQFSELREGDNDFSYQADGSNSVTHLRLAVIDAGLPLAAQVEHILHPH